VIAQETRLESALYYASLGWAVFPIWSVNSNGTCSCPKGKNCGRDTGKHPIGNLVPKGVNNATTDEETIKTWWEMEPTANIGIATGLVIVLDVDGKEGEESLLDAIGIGQGTFPITTEARTAGKNGGRHFYFDADGHDLHNAQPLGNLNGIDLRGTGGYVVAPPSTGTLGEYTWIKHPSEAPPAPVPEWIVNLRGEKSFPSPPTTGTVTEGNRHKHLRGLICSAWARGASPEAVKKMAHAENEAVCNPPKENEDIEKLINDLISRYPHGSHPPKENPLEDKKATHISMSEIMAIPGEIIPYSIERIAPADEVVGWYGDGGSMKSMTMLHAARCVSRNEPIFGAYKINSPGGFLYLDKENGPLRLKIRCKSLHITKNDSIFFLSKQELTGVYINSIGFSDFLLRSIDTMNPRPTIMCVDSWTRLLQTGKNENDAGDVANAMDILSEFAMKAKMSVFLIHHTRKPSPNDKSEAKIRVRGSVDFINAVSTAFMLERKGIDVLRFEQVKSRDFQYMPPCGIRAFWDNANDGRFCFEREGEAPTDLTKQQHAISEIPKFLITKGGNASKTEIVDALKWLASSKTITRALNSLESEGSLISTGGGQGRGKAVHFRLVTNQDQQKEYD
jgi:hypothetical protein